MNDIFSNIEAIRCEKGLKQSVVAERMHISQSSYSAYITKNTDIKFGVLIKIAEALDVPIIDIITYPDKYTSISHDGKNREYCSKCEQKDAIIKTLNNYINLLEDKLKQKK